MWLEERLQSMRLVAPDVDALLRHFDRYRWNPEPFSADLLAAVEPLARSMAPVAPLATNEEAKALWVRIPRGTIDDFGSFEDLRKTGEVETRDKFERLWTQEYPEPYVWYEFVLVRTYDREGNLSACGVSLGEANVVSMRADWAHDPDRGDPYAQACARRLCELVLPAVEESVEMLTAGTYNALVQAQLPYWFRCGVIRRSDLWEAEPDIREADRDGLPEETIKAFRELLFSGANRIDAIGRIRDFTANDFFRACEVGYASCGWDCWDLTPKELYLHYADGRDEGLTGAGHGLNEGPGIDADDPQAWETWYFDRNRLGGHPWEVVRGGSSTHVGLFVMSDRQDLEWELAAGTISSEDYERRLANAGYYFRIAGTHRPFEAINFYVALSSAGFPVIIDEADELLARLEATDWVGVVPHHVFTRHCEVLFPDSYQPIIDFTHVVRDEDPWFDKVVWLPEEEARLVEGQR